MAKAYRLLERSVLNLDEELYWEVCDSGAHDKERELLDTGDTSAITPFEEE
jgi:hypothetical protein